MEKVCRLTDQTIKNAIAELEADGFVEVQRENGIRNVYRVLVPPSVAIEGTGVANGGTPTVAIEGTGVVCHRPPIQDATVAIEGTKGIPTKGYPLEGRKPGREKFSPPTLEECLSCGHEIGMPDGEAEKAFHHYEANGWRQSNGLQIKKWEAALRSWNARNRTPGSFTKAPPATQSTLPLAKQF